MNTSLELRMKRHVERIVRPIRGRWQRKLRMREDLYAHLSAAFEEEARRLPNGEDAFRAAMARLGESAALTHDLQTTVPRLDRMHGLVQDWFGAGATELPSRIALRVWATTLLLTLVGVFATFVLANLVKPDHPTVRTGPTVLLVVSLWTSAWAASIVALMVHVGQGSIPGRWDARGAMLWIASLTTLPFIPPLWTYWMTTMWDTVWMWGALLCAIVSLGIACNAGWLLGKELKQRHPWEGLDLSTE